MHSTLAFAACLWIVAALPDAVPVWHLQASGFVSVTSISIFSPGKSLEDGTSPSYGMLQIWVHIQVPLGLCSGKIGGTSWKTTLL
jgi:hypothetical protein